MSIKALDWKILYSLVLCQFSSIYYSLLGRCLHLDSVFHVGAKSQPQPQHRAQPQHTSSPRHPLRAACKHNRFLHHQSLLLPTPPLENPLHHFFFFGVILLLLFSLCLFAYVQQGKGIVSFLQ
jgi:hypothetical protein